MIRIGRQPPVLIRPIVILWDCCLVSCVLTRPNFPTIDFLQCGRFQPLDEFDGIKRSCRKKLVAHAARRRRKEAEEKARQRSNTVGALSSPRDGGRPAKTAKIEPVSGQNTTPDRIDELLAASSVENSTEPPSAGAAVGPAGAPLHSREGQRPVDDPTPTPAPEISTEAHLIPQDVDPFLLEESIQAILDEFDSIAQGPDQLLTKNGSGMTPAGSAGSAGVATPPQPWSPLLPTDWSKEDLTALSAELEEALSDSLPLILGSLPPTPLVVLPMPDAAVRPGHAVAPLSLPLPSTQQQQQLPADYQQDYDLVDVSVSLFDALPHELPDTLRAALKEIIEARKKQEERAANLPKLSLKDLL